MKRKGPFFTVVWSTFNMVVPNLFIVVGPRSSLGVVVGLPDGTPAESRAGGGPGIARRSSGGGGVDGGGSGGGGVNGGGSGRSGVDDGSSGKGSVGGGGSGTGRSRQR
jgi:hypothetical protein